MKQKVDMTNFKMLLVFSFLSEYLSIGTHYFFKGIQNFSTARVGDLYPLGKKLFNKIWGALINSMGIFCPPNSIHPTISVPYPIMAA